MSNETTTHTTQPQDDQAFAKRMAAERERGDQQRHKEVSERIEGVSREQARQGAQLDELRAKIDAANERLNPTPPSGGLAGFMHKLDATLKAAQPYVIAAAGATAVGVGVYTGGRAAHRWWKGAPAAATPAAPDATAS